MTILGTAKPSVLGTEKPLAMGARKPIMYILTILLKTIQIAKGSS